MVLTGRRGGDDSTSTRSSPRAWTTTSGGGGLERCRRLLQDLNLTHPMPVRRVRELLDWVREGEYDRIVGGEYMRRGEEPPLREEADAAAAHYADRIGDAFRRRDRRSARSAEQLSEWLARQRRGGGPRASSRCPASAPIVRACWRNRRVVQRRGRASLRSEEARAALHGGGA